MWFISLYTYQTILFLISADGLGPFTFMLQYIKGGLGEVDLHLT